MDESFEQELLARAQTSAEGFGELFNRYYDRIYAYAYRRVGSNAAAEDIAACAFEDALHSIKRLRWDGKPVAAWLYRIASRRVADHYRRLRRDVPLDDDLQRSTVEGLETPLVQEEREAAVRAGLERLADKDREIIRLVYFDELEPAEIAALLNCKVNNVYVRLHRAIARLRGVLEAQEDVRERVQ